MSEDLDSRIFRELEEVTAEEIRQRDLGIELCEEGKFAEAIPVLKDFLSKMPAVAWEDVSLAHVYLGRCYAGLGYVQQGLREHLLAIEAVPKVSWAVRLCQLKERFQYLQEYPELLKGEAPVKLISQAFEGVALSKSGKHQEEAVSCFKSLLPALPSTANDTQAISRTHLATSYGHLGQA